MSGFAAELQNAIYDRLVSFPGMPPVYDAVPENNTNFPYVVLGADTHVPFDTDNSVGADSTLTLHVWSRYRGMKECKDIQALLYDALNRYELSVAGFWTVFCDFEYEDTLLDADGLTRHGVSRFRTLIEEE